MNKRPVPTTLHQAKRAKISDGLSVYVNIPANSNFVGGDLVEIDGFLGFLFQNVETGPGEVVAKALSIEQAEYETNQINPEDTFAVGTLVHWDSAEKVLTEEAEGNRLAGKVTSAKDANNVIWFILGPQV